MHARLILLSAAALAAIPATIAAASDRGPPSQAAQAFDVRAVVAAVRKAIAENYVIPAKRAPLDAVLAKGLAEGRYDVAEPQELAARVNADLAAVANDKHLGLGFDPKTSAELAKKPQNDEIQDSTFFREFARTRNHGVSELRVLEGNIRLLRYDGFVWTGEESAAAIDAAAAFLRGGDAIVIDLRQNGGGSPEAVKRLASYFVPAGKKLVTFHMRGEASATSISEEVPGGIIISGAPVYVLISSGTASAAEEFASHVAGFKFGTLVGETSAGAGFRNEHFAMPGGFVLSVSVGRPELPDGSDWEAKGVRPSIAVPAEKALDRAQQAALATLAAQAQGPRRTELEWASALIGARLQPATPALPLAAYAGRFGPRTVEVEGNGLRYRRDGGIETALLPLGADLFALDADPRTRVRFVSANGAVTGFVLERADGTSTEQPRS